MSSPAWLLLESLPQLSEMARGRPQMQLPLQQLWKPLKLLPLLPVLLKEEQGCLKAWALHHTVPIPLHPQAKGLAATKTSSFTLRCNRAKWALLVAVWLWSWTQKQETWAWESFKKWHFSTIRICFRPVLLLQGSKGSNRSSRYVQRFYWSIDVQQLSYISIYVIGFVCLAGQLPWDITSKFFSQVFSYLPCFLGTMDFYIYTTFGNLGLERASHVQCKSKRLDFILSHTSQLIRMKCDLVFMHIKLNILVQTLSEVYGNKGNNWCFTKCKKNVHVGMYSDIYQPVLFELGVMTDSIVLHFDVDVTVNDRDLDSRSQECKKPSALVISQSFQLVWMEFAVLLRHVRLMNIIFIVSHLISIQGRKPYLGDFIPKKRV